MPLEQTSRLPFTDNFAVHVQLRISSSGSGYLADISADWSNWHRFHIELTTQDVAELNTELQQAVEQVSGNLEMSDSCGDALSQLILKGNFAFKKVFPQGVPREMISKALKTGATIQFSSEDFFIPWELLYDGPLGGKADVSYFWGMRHIVSRALIQDARPGDLESPVIQSLRPHVGLIACNNLEYVVKREIPALRRLHQSKQIRLLLCHPMNADQRDTELEEFGRFLRKKMQIAHLACHACKEQQFFQSYLLVSNDFPITIEDFGTREFEIKHRPFVILNACLTGTINPLHTANWAAEFWKRGARGVLATEFHVPDSFAAAFTEELYNHFLSGKPIGEALLATRRYFWEKQSNPLGLAYALYSSPSIRIAK
jgi:hypothetical protein